MKLKLLFTALLMHLVIFMHAQQLFTNKYKKAQQTALVSLTESYLDSSYYFAGYTNYKDSLNHFFPYPSILKTSFNGDVKAYKEYNILGNIEWNGFSNIVADTINDCKYITGFSDGFDSTGNFILHNFLGKLDSNLEINFLKYVYLSDYDVVAQVKPTLDGGLIIVGTFNGNTNLITNTPQRCFLLKLNSMLIQEWCKIYHDSISSTGSGVYQLADSSFIVSGFVQVSGSSTSNNWFVMKTNKTGNVIWSKKSSGTSEKAQRGACSIVITNDSNLIIGYTSVSNTIANSYMSLAKLDLTGNLIWHRFINNDPLLISSHLNGDIFVLGSSWTTILDSTGSSQTSIYQNFPFSLTSNAILHSKSNEYLLCGVSDFPNTRNAFVSKCDSNSISKCNSNVSSFHFSVLSGINLIPFLLKDSIVVCNELSLSYMIFDSIPTTVQLCPNAVSEEAMEFNKLAIFPNPSVSNINIQSQESILSIDIIDLFGNSYLRKTHIGGNHLITDISYFESGIYIAKIETSTGISYRKIIKQSN